MTSPVLILGCGFTGARVAGSLLERGVEVFVTARDPARLAALERHGACVLPLDATAAASVAALPDRLPESMRAVHSIPPSGTAPALLAALAGRMERLVYISSTGVYGVTRTIDETTPAAPVTPMQHARREAEQEVLGCGVPALVLRAPAIYGPGRGMHAMMRAGRYRFVGAGEQRVSRIHVDDLAAHVVAGLHADVTGAWPLADDEAATSAEVAHFCADLLGVPLPPSGQPDEVHETLRVTRAVSGAAIRERLGVSLRHPTYREGIPAALAEEASAGEV